MVTIDEKRFRQRIDETYPFTEVEQSRHGMADIAKGAILKLLIEEMKPMKGVTGIIEDAKEQMCLKYCKYPDTWDEEKEGCELIDSEVYLKCPLNNL